MIHRTRDKADEAVVMAGIALRTGRNVRRRLGEGINGSEAAAMAGRTQGRGAGVVHAGGPETDVVPVTGIALRRGRNMGAGFTECRDTVVAGRTIADGTGAVNEICPCPADIATRMASITLSTG